jgi:hypothetical protein
MDGRIWTFSSGKVGTNDLHAAASSCCVFSCVKSSSLIETAVRSRRENVSHAQVESPRTSHLTPFKVTVCVSNVSAENNLVKETV